MNNFQRSIMRRGLKLKDKLSTYELNFLDKISIHDEMDENFELTKDQNKLLNSISDKIHRIQGSQYAHNKKRGIIPNSSPKLHHDLDIWDSPDSDSEDE